MNTPFPFPSSREIAIRSLRTELAKAEQRASMTAQFSDFLRVFTIRAELIALRGES